MFPAPQAAPIPLSTNATSASSVFRAPPQPHLVAPPPLASAVVTLPPAAPPSKSEIIQHTAQMIIAAQPPLQFDASQPITNQLEALLAAERYNSAIAVAYTQQRFSAVDQRLADLDRRNEALLRQTELISGAVEDVRNDIRHVANEARVQMTEFKEQVSQVDDRVRDLHHGLTELHAQVPDMVRSLIATNNMERERALMASHVSLTLSKAENLVLRHLFGMFLRQGLDTTGATGAPPVMQFDYEHINSHDTSHLVFVIPKSVGSNLSLFSNHFLQALSNPSTSITERQINIESAGKQSATHNRLLASQFPFKIYPSFNVYCVTLKVGIEYMKEELAQSDPLVGLLCLVSELTHTHI